MATTAVLALGLLSPARAQPEAAAPAMLLPTFQVKEPRLLPQPEAWRHAQVPGFEIFSNDSDAHTQRLIADFLSFQRAVGVIWPPLQRNFDLPVYIVLCAGPAQFGEFLPAGSEGNAAGVVSLTLRDREQAAIVIDAKTAAQQGTPAGAPGDLDDYSRRVLRGEYVHFLVSRMQPKPPPWLEAGLTRLFEVVVCGKDTFSVPASNDSGDLEARRAFALKVQAAARNNDPSPGLDRDPAFQAAITQGSLLQLDQLFADRPMPTLSAEDSAWGRECYQFAHLCLLGSKTRTLAQSFADFALKASLRPADEDVFRACFNMKYETMLALLWSYVGFAENQGFSLRNPDGTPFPAIAPLSLRDASDAEVGRFKGDILRMGHRDEASHLSLIAPYVRGSRDPQLLAALGLEEYSAGRADRARQFLEAATSAHTARARAYLELARLRLPANGGKLSVDQMIAVLKPLAAARKLPPPLPEVYELLADVWARSSVTPKRGNLAMIDDGVGFFPFNTDLVARDAELRARYGYGDDARAIAAIGLNYAADGPARDRLLRLK